MAARKDPAAVRTQLALRVQVRAQASGARQDDAIDCRRSLRCVAARKDPATRRRQSTQRLTGARAERIERPQAPVEIVGETATEDGVASLDAHIAANIPVCRVVDASGPVVGQRAQVSCESASSHAGASRGSCIGHWRRYLSRNVHLSAAASGYVRV